MKAFNDQRETDKAADENDLMAFKTPLDDQIALVKTESDTLKDLKRVEERKQATVDKLQKEFDETTEAPGTAAYDELQTQLNNAKTARDEAKSAKDAQETKKTEEEDKIQALQDTYDEKTREKSEARDEKAINDAHTLLYGDEGDASAGRDPVEGVVDKVRKAEKQYSNAHVELS